MMTIELLGAQYGQEKPQQEEVEHWRNSAWLPLLHLLNVL